jgi:FKBP-type peptidyl-prolyl cis-trans isomerase (trigger factor)
MQMDKEQKAGNEVESLVDALKVLVSEIEHKEYKNYEDLKIKFTQLKSTVEDLGEFLEEDIDNEALEKEANEVANKANKIIRRLATEMRLHSVK